VVAGVAALSPLTASAAPPQDANAVSSYSPPVEKHVGKHDARKTRRAHHAHHDDAAGTRDTPPDAATRE
jgi:hypothetical protein